MPQLDRASVSTNFLSMSAWKMANSVETIRTCVARLSEQQLHHRGGEHENSVVNLLLHLEGNIRQWVHHGIGGHPDVRTRDAEFALNAAATGAEALERLQTTVAEAQAIVIAVPATRLLEIIDPQPTGTWRHTTVLEAIYKVVSHLDHHTGQIILLTKQLAGADLDLSMPRKR